MVTSVDTVSSCDVRVLGDLEVVGPDGPAEIRPGLPRVLFDMLAVRANDVIPAEVLIDQLWPEASRRPRSRPHARRNPCSPRECVHRAVHVVASRREFDR